MKTLMAILLVFTFSSCDDGETTPPTNHQRASEFCTMIDNESCTNDQSLSSCTNTMENGLESHTQCEDDMDRYLDCLDSCDMYCSTLGYATCDNCTTEYNALDTCFSM